MFTLPLDSKQRHGEWQQILHIAHKNNFPTNMITQLKRRIKRSLSQPEPPTPTSLNNHTKWAMFTYSSPQIREVTNNFKHTNIRLAFKFQNSRLSKPINKTPPTAPYDRCDIYLLSCMTCNKEYVGKASHNFKLRYKEHELYIKNNNLQSAYVFHILNNRHEYDPIEKK